jgi:hypothetical protein
MWLKSVKNISILHEDLSTFECFKRQTFVKKAFLQHSLFYAVDSDMSLNHSHRTHCCVSTAAMVKRKLHNVTLYVSCLSSFTY